MNRHHPSFPVSPIPSAVLFVLLAQLCAGCGTDRKTYTIPGNGTSPTGSATNTGNASPSPVGSSTTSGSTSSSTTTPAQAPPRSGLTQHPIVLLHGIGGFAKLGPLDGFNQVPGHLRGLGAEVLVPQVASLGTIDQRAEQLRDAILAAYPDPNVKVNIIAHSMGGLDARAAIVRYGLGDRVATLTTIATPHRGSPVADEAVERLPPATKQAIDDVLQKFQWSFNSVVDLTTDQVQNVFNPSTPDDPRVVYQSYGCEADPGGTRSGAAIHPILTLPWSICFQAEGANDGLVPLTSAKWGDYKGTLPTDHLGAIGHFAGNPSFDHLKFYTDLVYDLVARGY